MLHNMKLNASPFEKIKNGTKTIELRLNDEKRQQVKTGDFIEFSCIGNGELKSPPFCLIQSTGCFLIPNIALSRPANSFGLLSTTIFIMYAPFIISAGKSLSRSAGMRQRTEAPSAKRTKCTLSRRKKPVLPVRRLFRSGSCAFWVFSLALASDPFP